MTSHSSGPLYGITMATQTREAVMVTHLLDAPALDGVGGDSGHARQQLAVLLPAERQVASGLRRHGGQEDGLMEGGLQA